MRGEVERIADVVVEFVPGDRELAERIAGAVWEHLRRPPHYILLGLDLDVEAWKSKARPAMWVAPERDEAAIKAEALREVADVLNEMPTARRRDHYGFERDHADGKDAERDRIEDWLRERADALSGAEDDGATGRPERAPDRYKAALRGADGAGEAQGAHGIGNDEGDQG